MKRELKTFKVTEEEIDNYQFTKKQISAYNSLKKATERCEKYGLSLLSQQFSLVAIPSKFYMNHMTSTSDVTTKKRIEVPVLSGAKVSDSGADDTEYILDEFIN